MKTLFIFTLVSLSCYSLASSRGALRTGKMSEKEKKALSEINKKEEKIDYLADQITENMEFLQMRAEMVGEELDVQKEVVQKGAKKVDKQKGRLEDFNQELGDVMEKDLAGNKEKKPQCLPCGIL